MTVPMLSAARTVVFLVVGADKAEAARRAFLEEPSPATPASLVRSAEGRTLAILDRDAAARALGIASRLVSGFGLPAPCHRGPQATVIA